MPKPRFFTPPKYVEDEPHSRTTSAGIRNKRLAQTGANKGIREQGIKRAQNMANLKKYKKMKAAPKSKSPRYNTALPMGEEKNLNPTPFANEGSAIMKGKFKAKGYAPFGSRKPTDSVRKS